MFILLNESGLLQGDYKGSELYQTSLKLGIIGKPEDDTRSSEPSPEELNECKELVLRVDGMWCSSCSWLIEKVVGGENGVVHSRILYASDTAKIFYKPEIISPEHIVKRIERLGYSTNSRDASIAESRPERKSLLIRMGVALFLVMNLMYFSYTLYVGYFQELPPQILSLIPAILFGLASPAVFWCAIPIHRKAWQSLRGMAPTMELLFSIGIFSAFFYSTYELFSGGEHFYFDTAGSLVALLLVGKFIELSAKHKTSESINRLYQMLPKKVRIKAPEGERLVAVDKLSVGDRFIVKSGEKIPADGVVVEGNAIVDESLLTGESKSIEKRVGSAVVASSMNVNGVIDVEAVRIGNDTALSSIIKLVERALSSRSELEQMVDRFARVFIPAIIVVAFGVGIVLALTGAGVETALIRSITILVIACPCALGMATPLAIAAGIGYAAKRGILIRDGAALQVVGRVSTVVFDKTGTLTEGKFTLLNTLSDEHLRLVASLEQSSNHPIAQAIVDAARGRGLQLTEATHVQILDGKGITGIVEGTQLAAGSMRCVLDSGFDIDEGAVEISEREAELGHTIVFLGVGRVKNAVPMVLGDSLKPSSHSAIEQLTKAGVAVRLLSGDMEKTTSAVARNAGIDLYTAQALPSDKIEAIKKFQNAQHIVAMVGDGVNDAPALAQADVGIAMGGGTEIAVESATITLLRDDLTLVPEALDISKRSFAAVKQNLAWAYFYNSIGIILAILGYLNPFIAAIAMLASSLSVVLNSMRVSLPKGMFSKRLVEILFPWIEPAESA
ncbi:MAG: cation-translocating P-type ATPase [Bacteroidetes bacterium]|nr:cation-translocating P-type ATPase [Bacteroidota bacterium]MCW5894660.1 cation-translocating P-type ATPase [Bacteroidota bacterium]